MSVLYSMKQHLYITTLSPGNNFTIEKSHTCEEGRAHLRNFFLALIDEHEKLIIIKKTVKVGQ